MVTDYDVRTDGRTCWVNGLTMLGRFSKMGIDIHVNSQCLPETCMPGPCTKKHWRQFQYLMLEHHEIDVPDKYMPKYLEEE